MFKRRRDEDGPAAPAPPPARLFPVPSAGTDDGLSVPPFEPEPTTRTEPDARPQEMRPPDPTALREVKPMSRPPQSPSPNQPPAAPPGLPPRPPLPTMHPAPSFAPPGSSHAAPPPVQEHADKRTLVVGRGISLQGTIQDAQRLVVEGTVEAQLLNATELAVSPGGTFKGEVEVDSAEVAGTLDGAVTARGNLIVRSTGRIVGTARCRRLQVEDGGQISGRIEMIAEGGPPLDS